MMPRVYTTKFPWSEARKLRAKGWTYTDIAKKFGVSPAAVRLACDDYARSINRFRNSVYQKDGTCIDCGGPCSHNSKYPANRCNTCAGKLRRTTVREDELKCTTCKEWKPDAEFPMNRTEPARRNHHTSCRPCGNALRTEHRHRNIEKARAYDRERYKRRKR
jgi:hypothetical protein